MAYADYRLCDKCGEKAFYDANLNYDFDAPPLPNGDVKLDYLGDWAVLCGECAKEWEVKIVPRAALGEKP